MNRFIPDPIEKFPVPLRGTVEEAIAPDRLGRVNFRSSYWPAKFYQCDRQPTLYPGDPVTVLGYQGITLLVKPL